MNSQNFFDVINTIASPKFKVIIRIMLEQKERDFTKNEILEYCSIEDITKLLNLNIIKPSTLNENNNLFKLNPFIIDFAKKMDNQIVFDINSNSLLKQIDEVFELLKNTEIGNIIETQQNLIDLIELVDTNFNNNIEYYRNRINKEYKAIERTEVKYKNLTNIMDKIEDFMKEHQTFQNILEKYRYVYSNNPNLSELKRLIQGRIFYSNSYIYLDIGKITLDITKYINKYRNQSKLVEKMQNFLKISSPLQKEIIDKYTLVIEPIQINGLLLNENSEVVMTDILSFKKELKAKIKHIKDEDRVVDNNTIKQKKVIEKVFRLENIQQKFKEYSREALNDNGRVVDLISFLDLKLSEHNQRYRMVGYYIELIQRYGERCYKIKGDEVVRVEYQTKNGKNRVVKVPVVLFGG